MTLNLIFQAIIRRKVLLLSLAVLLVTLPILYLVIKYRSPVQAAWMNDSWSYRKSIAVTNNTTQQTNVYISVTLNTSDTARFQADCGDLRFTNASGKQLKYYIVSGCRTASNVIHVLLDVFPAGSQYIYYYYGNPSAANGFSSADFSTVASNYTVGSLGTEEKSQGPVAYWKFDEGYGSSTNDSTQDNYDGSLGSTAGTDAGAPTWATEDQCLSGKCLQFDGTNDAVDFDDYDNLKALQFDTGNWSVSAWIRAPSGSSKRVVFGLKTGDDQDFNIGIDSSNRAYVEWVSYPSHPAYSTTTSSSSIADGKWHQIGAKREGGTITLYVDGVSVGTDSTVGSYDITGPPWFSRWTAGAWFFGCCTTFDAGVWQNFFKGFMDEIKVYPYARTAAQIKSDFASKGSGSVKGTAASLGSSSKNSDAFSNGLVGYWKMDEASWTNDCTATSVTDSSGNANNGKACPATTGPTGGAAGKFGNAGSFDGTEDYVDMGSGSSLNITGVISLAAWVKIPSSPTNGQLVVISKGASTNGYTLTTSGTNTTLTFMVGGTYKTSNSFTSIADNSWHHVAASYDKQKVYFYLDGTNVGSQVVTADSPSTANNVRVGYYWGSAWPYPFQGLIDDVRIYNRSLSSKEVRDLYNWAPGPVGYWNMDEGTGATANDISGNGANGTATGTTIISGKFGKARQFTASDNVSATIVDPAYSNTIEAWIYPTTSVASKTIITTSKLTTDSSSRPVYGGCTGTALSLNQWTYIAATSTDSTHCYLYQNGAQTASGGTGVTFGTSVGIGQSSFLGKIDEVKIYNYARSSKQIVEDMNAGHPSGGSPVGSQVGYWKMDEGYGQTSYDSTINGSNGTLGSTTGSESIDPTWSQNGKFGKALLFDGVDDIVTVGNINSLNVQTGDFTISAWIYTGAGGGIIISKDNCGDANQYYLALSGLKPQLRVTNSAVTSYYVTAIHSISANTWSYITGVKRGNQTEIYINGKLDNITPISGTFNTSTFPVWIGNRSARSNPSCNVQFGGLIDEIKVYNAALTSDEIALDYNRGSAMVLGSLSDTSGLTGGSVASNSAQAEYCIPGDTTSCNSPVGEWKMDEGTGITAYDVSGNNKAASITNGTWTAGKIGKGISYNGTSTTVNLGAQSELTTAGTVELWFKYDSSKSTTAYERIISTYDDANNEFRVLLDNSTPRKLYWIHKKANVTTGYSVTSFDNNTWHQITYISDTGSNISKMYLDGVNIYSTTSNVQVYNYAANWYLGSNTDTNYWFPGLIDQVRIYNYARTPAQVAYDYNRGGPVGWWKMDECQGGTANDSSGNGNTGTITIGATGSQTTGGTCTAPTDGTGAWYNGRTGKYNSSLNFDGTDDKVTAGSMKIETTMTISGWIKKTSSTGQKSFFSNRGGGNVYFGLTGTQVFLYDNAGSPAPITSASGSVTIGQWQHVVATSDGTTTKFYVNGVLVTNTSQTRAASTGTVGIGWDPNIGTEYWDGQIDDVKIFNYALTPLQVKTVYNEGSSIRFGPVTGSP